MTGKGINRSVSYLGCSLLQFAGAVSAVSRAGGRARRRFAAPLCSPMLSDAPLAPTCVPGARGEVVQGVLQALRAVPAGLCGPISRQRECGECSQVRERDDKRENGLSSESGKLLSAKSKETGYRLGTLRGKKGHST